MSINPYKEIFAESDRDRMTIIPLTSDKVEVDFLKSDFLEPLLAKGEGFYFNEKWKSDTNICAQVLQVDKERIVCECLLDRENKIFERRIFQRDLFSHLQRVEKGVLVYINVKIKPGSFRIDIYNGRDLVDPELFRSLELSGNDFAFISEPFKGIDR